MTVLELTFVIVVIGLVASIAIPKLSASRQDAYAVSNVSNLTACINENMGYLVAGNSFNLESSSCKASQLCFVLTLDEQENLLDVTTHNSENSECPSTHELANRQKLVKTYSINYKPINL